MTEEHDDVALEAPKTSSEKALAFIEGMANLPDSELQEVLPIASPVMIRAGLAAAAGQIPEDPHQLDDWLLRAAYFVLDMRSDQALGYVLVGVPDAEVEDINPQLLEEEDVDE